MSFQGAAPLLFGTPSMVTATLGANDGEIGTRATYGGSEWVLFFNSGGQTISQYKGAVVTATTGYSCTVSSVTNVDVCFGVCQNADIPTLNYGWLLTRGFGRVIMGADNSAAVAERIQLGTDGVFARAVTAVTDTAYGVVCGKLMSAVASGGSGAAWIKAFG